MIINGGSRSNWRFFAKHLVSVAENERADITEIRGLAADTVLGALREMDALASGTRCKNFFYHANLNPRADEQLDPAQWEQAVDALERNLGLDGHSRLVVEHVKDGRQHRHVVWSRIDIDRMSAVPDSHNYAAHERTARELEEMFGQPGVRGAHDRKGPRPPRRPRNWETFRGHQSGITPDSVTREITALWHQADSGKAFAASLNAHGYRLCKGDRRDYCIVDAAGDAHSLARRIDGVKVAAVRERLADLDRDALPSVAEAAAVPSARPAAVVTADPAPVLAPAEPAAAAAEIAKPARAPATALDAFAHQVIDTMMANDGEPHFGDGMSFIERSLTVLEAAGSQAVAWVKGRWQDLVERFRPGDHSGPGDHDVER